jgi:uncharacterized repeat protein (TIGR02543 family)
MIQRNTKYLSSAILCVLLSQAACFATDYYVDATAGNDGNSGQGTSVAWRTMAKVNSYTGFAAGDRILLHRGQTWREQLIVPANGASGNPVVFGAYGTGNNPVLKGSALVTNWASAGSNRWSASLGSAPNQVFFNGVRGTKEGALSSVSGSLQWYWASGVLYVYATSDPDSAYTNPGIEASIRPSTRSYGMIHIAGRQYVTVQDINVSQSASFGIYIRPTSRYVTLQGCDAGHSLDGGIVASTGSTPSTQILVENCASHHNNGGFKEGAPGVTTYHEGLTMEGIDGFTIRGVQVYSNYMEGVNFKRGARNGIIENSFLYANGLINQYLEGATNIQIRYNRIYDCSYNAGIEFGLETDTFSNDTVQIYDNVFWGNAGGVSFWSSSVTAQTKNISIYNNTFFDNWEAIRFKSGATDNYSGTNYIKNNLIWQNGTGNWAIRDYTTNRQAISRTTVAYNAFQQGSPTDTTGTSAKVITNPYFVNAGSHDFHLTSSSACINAGTSVGLTRDFDGTAVPQGGTPDIGAYEYGSGTTTGYTLTVSATNGTVSKSPNQSTYASGTSVSLQATPNSGYTFTGWSGDLTGTANPATIVMDSNKSVTANFTAATTTTYTLTVSATNGTVTKTPNQASYASGTSVSLQATANSGYTFTGWSGDLTGTANPATITMNSNKSVTANFASTSSGTTKTVGVTTVLSDATTVVLRRAIPCTMPEAGKVQSLSMYHDAGSGLMILAVYSDSSGKPGSRIALTNTTTVSSTQGWQTIPLQSPISVSAGQKIWLAWVFQNSVGIRAAAGTPGRADSGLGWTAGMPTTFGTSSLANYNYSIYATYTPASTTMYTLTVSATNGTVTKTPNQTSYAAGTSVSLKATPNSGYTFTGWSGALTGTTNPATITMDSNKSVTANFASTSGGTTTKTIGTTTVLSDTTAATTRRAVPCTMPEAGKLQSLSMYHQAGSGLMILAVYSDSAGKPGSRLGLTNKATVSGTAGWQTIPLQSPLSVSANQKIWLSWVYQNSVGIRAAAGTPGRADSSLGWSAGMPTTFGSSTLLNYNYSIYATYTPTTTTAAISTLAVGAPDAAVLETPSTSDTLAGGVTPKATDNVPQAKGPGKASPKAIAPKATEPATEDQGQTLPTLADGAGAPGSVATPSEMMVLHVRDAGKGVNPASVTIEVDGHVVYTGDVDSSSTAYGVCSRSGSQADYIYTYQPKESSGAQLVVAVDARDLAGNVIPEQTYLFGATQSAAPDQTVALDQSNLDQRGSATARDSKGNTWSIWQAGDAGQQQIYISRLSGGPETSDDTVPLTQGQGDHSNPAVAVDGAGVLYAVWQENVRGNWNVCVSVSADGKVWSTPKAIVDANENQVNPAIAASRQPSGLVAVTWQDDQAGNQDVYLATSTDAFTTAQVSAVTAGPADQTDPAVTVDGEDAIFMRWTDTGSGSTAPVESPQEN